MIHNYKKLCSEYYDLDKPVAPSDAVDFYYSEILKINGIVLEPMCGTGRFLIPLLERGIDIHGVDASSEMLDLCKNKLRAKNLSTELYFQSIQNLNLPTKYDYIFIPSGSFGLITDKEEAKESLKRLFDHLSLNGKLDIEIEKPYSFFEDDIHSESCVIRSDKTKIKLITSKRYDFINNIETINCTYQNIIDNNIDSVENEKIEVQHYGLNEFKNLAHSVGFEEVKTLSWYSNLNADECMLFRCEKNIERRHNLKKIVI